jgi:hypothetical protein
LKDATQDGLGDNPVTKKHKTQAGINLVARPQKLALGDNIMLLEVSGMAEKAVVGCANGHHLGYNKLREWVKISWTGFLDYFPSVHLLTKGWFMLKFQSTADVDKVLKALWCIDSTSMFLKR